MKWYGLVASELQTIAVGVVTKSCIVLLLQNRWEGQAFFFFLAILLSGSWLAQTTIIRSIKVNVESFEISL